MGEHRQRHERPRILFVMGDHSGHLAEHYDGLGYWSGWNNRISSRYRN